MKKKIKCAVIGCGLWGHHHCLVFNEGQYSELVAVCDKDISKAKAFGEEFNVNYYTDAEKMYASEEIDAVGIATPDFSHFEPLISAISHDKNILVEKPIVIDSEELDKVVDLIEKHKNIRIMVDYHMRYAPYLVVAVDKIHNDDLGSPISVYMRQNDVIGFATRVVDWTISWASKSSVLWFLGSHTVDCVSWIFSDKVKKVYSVVLDGLLKSKGVNTEDAYYTTLEFEKGGIAQIENGWVTPNGNPNVIDVKIEVLCSKGLVRLDLSSNNFLQIYTEQRVENPDFTIFPKYLGQVYGLAFESIRDFIRKLYLEEEFLFSFEDSVASNKVLFAIQESSKNKVPVLVKY